MSSFYYSPTHAEGVTKTISITSGKGGVGKSSMVANMALQMAKEGKKVLILDGDWGMANIDIMFGVRPKHSIEDVLVGTKSIKDVIVEVHPGVDLIPGGQGLYNLQYIEPLVRRHLLDQVGQLEGIYDVMLIDTAPGIADNVLYLNSAAQEICIVLGPDPSSLTDAYSLIKVLNQRHKETRFSIMCNQVADEIDALRVFKRLDDVAAQFLCVRLKYIGFVPFDPDLRNATKSQQLVVLSRPMSASGQAIERLSQKLSGFRELRESKGGMQFFWEQMMGVA